MRLGHLPKHDTLDLQVVNRNLTIVNTDSKIIYVRLHFAYGNANRMICTCVDAKRQPSTTTQNTRYARSCTVNVRLVMCTLGTLTRAT